MGFQRVHTYFGDSSMLFLVAGGKSQASHCFESLGLGNSGSGPGFFFLLLSWEGDATVGLVYLVVGPLSRERCSNISMALEIGPTVGFGKKLDCSSWMNDWDTLYLRSDGYYLHATWPNGCLSFRPSFVVRRKMRAVRVRLGLVCWGNGLDFGVFTWF